MYSRVGSDELGLNSLKRENENSLKRENAHTTKGEDSFSQMREWGTQYGGWAFLCALAAHSGTAALQTDCCSFF